MDKAVGANEGGILAGEGNEGAIEGPRGGEGLIECKGLPDGATVDVFDGAANDGTNEGETVDGAAANDDIEGAADGC